MKKEANVLLQRSTDSLILCIELFNRPSECGRPEAVLILLDHALELLLKAAMLHRGGTIRRRGANQTFGFDECVRKCLTGRKRFLTEEQALLLQSVNSLRDAAQHHLVYLSESHLYIQVQAALTLYAEALKLVFNQDLRTALPPRVLPVSTEAPTDLLTLFEREVHEIAHLLTPGRRRHLEAQIRLRGLAIVDGAMRGLTLQPTDDQLKALESQIASNKSWEAIFPGVASINISAIGHGPSIDLRITKNEGMNVHLVPEGTPGATTVAVRRVDELGFYNLSLTQVSHKLGLSAPKTTALVRFSKIQADSDCFKEIAIGKSRFQRYSQKTVERLRSVLAEHTIDEIWRWSRSASEGKRT